MKFIRSTFNGYILTSLDRWRKVWQWKGRRFVMDCAGTSQKWRTKKDGHSGNVGQTDSKHFQAWPPESIGLGISTLETLKINICLCHPLLPPSTTSSHHLRWAVPKSAIISIRGTQPGYVENKYLRVCVHARIDCESDTVSQYLMHLIIRARWHDGSDFNVQVI